MKQSCGDGWSLEFQAHVAHDASDIAEVRKALNGIIAFVTRAKDALQISQMLYTTKVQLQVIYVGLRDCDITTDRIHRMESQYFPASLAEKPSTWSSCPWKVRVEPDESPKAI